MHLVLVLDESVRSLSVFFSLKATHTRTQNGARKGGPRSYGAGRRRRRSRSSSSRLTHLITIGQLYGTYERGTERKLATIAPSLESTKGSAIKTRADKRWYVDNNKNRA